MRSPLWSFRDLANASFSNDCLVWGRLQNRTKNCCLLPLSRPLEGQARFWEIDDHETDKPHWTATLTGKEGLVIFKPVQIGTGGSDSHFGRPAWPAWGHKETRTEFPAAEWMHYYLFYKYALLSSLSQLAGERIFDRKMTNEMINRSPMGCCPYHVRLIKWLDFEA